MYFEFHQQGTDVSIPLNGIAAGEHYLMNVLRNNISQESVSEICLNERNNGNGLFHAGFLAQSPENDKIFDRLTVSDDDF